MNKRTGGIDGNTHRNLRLPSWSISESYTPYSSRSTKDDHSLRHSSHNPPLQVAAYLHGGHRDSFNPSKPRQHFVFFLRSTASCLHIYTAFSSRSKDKQSQVRISTPMYYFTSITLRSCLAVQYAELYVHWMVRAVCL